LKCSGKEEKGNGGNKEKIEENKKSGLKKMIMANENG